MNHLSTGELEGARDAGSHADCVQQWRHEQFLKLGFDDSQAMLLAHCTHVDLGRVRGLMAHGCDRTTLMRIVI
jgi:hypothetical protein